MRGALECVAGIVMLFLIFVLIGEAFEFLDALAETLG